MDSVTVPEPVPPLPPVTVTNDALFVTVQLQPLVVVTLIEAVPALDEALTEVADSVYAHEAAGVALVVVAGLDVEGLVPVPLHAMLIRELTTRAEPKSA